MVRQTRGSITLFAISIALWLVFIAGPASAQSALSTIHGTVRDESGAAMPGVTVTLSSPSLQVGQIVVVSEADVTYRDGE